MERSLKVRIGVQKGIVAILFLIIVSAFHGVSVEGASKAKTDSATPSGSQQKEFDTPKEAAESLIQAASAFDVPALKEILGPDSADIISSEDQVGDKNRAIAFANKAKEKMLLGTDPKNSKSRHSYGRQH
jgi:hypothetical protein